MAKPRLRLLTGMYRKFERRIAFAKLRSMTEAAKILRQKYLGRA
jgi:hypothetical protein